MATFLKKYIFLLLIVLSSIAFFAHAAGRYDFSRLKEENPSHPEWVRSYDIIRAEDAWNKIASSSSPLTQITIGIIDSGVDVAHQEFTIAGDTNNTVQFGNTPLSAKKATDNHGTAVAGIIGANNISANGVLSPNSLQTNGILSGVLPISKYTLEVRNLLGANDLFFEQLKDIYEQSQLLHADVVNISRGTVNKSIFTFPPFTVTTDIYALVFVSHPNTLFVFSAGNDGVNVDSVTPANIHLANTITVGATDFFDKRAIFSATTSSNFGTGVDISAPQPVFAPFPNNRVNIFSGTSAAAPLVTGVAGLLKSINPVLTPAQIKQILIRTADPIIADQPIGGRLNALQAVCDPLVLNCTPFRTVLYGGVGQESINSGALIVVDQNTGKGRVIGTPVPGKFISGLAFDSNGTLYGSFLDTAGRSTLIKVDPRTGTLAETIGAITNGLGGENIDIGDLAIQPGTNVLFGLRNHGDSFGKRGKLYTIDTNTGVATFVGDTKTDAGGAIAFAPDGTLYQTTFLRSGNAFFLNTINPADASLITSVPSDFFDGLTVRPSDGVLFGNRGKTSGGNGDEIYTIDPATGNVTLIGSTIVGGASDLDFGSP